MITAYIIHNEYKGELKHLPGSEPPPYVKIYSAPAFTGLVDNSPDYPAGPIEPDEIWLNNTGYRWVGAVNCFAWVYS